MRLKSSIWVAAYLRRCQTEGIFGAVRRRGAEEAGAVFVKVGLLNGNAMLYVPAPQTVYDDSRPIERIFTPTSKEPVPESSVEERLAKEIRFDPDVWIVETEDKAGRHFLDLARGESLTTPDGSIVCSVVGWVELLRNPSGALAKMMGIARAQPILRVGAELTLRTRAWHDTGAGLRRRRTPLGGQCGGARTFVGVRGWGGGGRRWSVVTGEANSGFKKSSPR